MSSSTKIARLAILFADICGSTALYDEFGDHLARQMISQCINIMSGQITSHHGMLVKTIGDGILCTFPGAEDALLAACAMQIAVEKGEPGGSHPMYIHIGFHYGEVICEDNDVYGNAVNIAARVAEKTRTREILTTQETVDVLPPELLGRVHEVFRSGIRGKQKEFDIYRVIWESGDAESVRIGLPQDRI